MKTTEIPWILKIKRLSICPQEWAVRFLFLCRRLVFFMSFGPSSFKSSPSSFGWSQWPWCLPELHQGQTLGSVHMPLTHASPCHMPVLPHWGVFFWRQRTTQHQTLGTFFLKENVNSLTPPRDLDKLQSGWKLPSFILPRPHWLKICRSNDFAECLQSVLLLGILSSTAFKWVVTVHKVKRVSFPFQMQKDTRRVRSLGQKKKAWHSPL